VGPMSPDDGTPTAPQPDLHATVLRLIEEVGKLREPRTDDHLEAALGDLADGPWRTAPRGALAQDFRDTVERSAAPLRTNVRLTLGLDKPHRWLSERRGKQQGRPKGIGGTAQLRIDSYELSQILYALLMSKALGADHHERTTHGLVIREVTVWVVLDRTAENHHIKLIAQCEHDGERVVLVPAPFAAPAVGRLQVTLGPNDPLPDGEVIASAGGTAIDPTSSDFGYYHAVVLEQPLSAGDYIHVTLRTKNDDDLQKALAKLLRWQIIGTERHVTIGVVAPTFLLGGVRAIKRSRSSGKPLADSKVADSEQDAKSRKFPATRLESGGRLGTSLRRAKLAIYLNSGGRCRRRA
jgi:hypothetical protein